MSGPEARDFFSSAKNMKMDQSDREEKDGLKKPSSRTYTVEVGHRLMIYQQIFNWPGQSYSLGVIEASNTHMNEIVSFKIDRKDDKPMDRTREWYGLSNNLICSQEGKYGLYPPALVTSFHLLMGFRYAWIVPQYTYNRNLAASGFEFIPSTKACKRSSVNGSKGPPATSVISAPFRTDEEKTVKRVMLLRSSEAVYLDNMHPLLPDEWVGITSDLNKGYGEDFLYLVWTLSDD
ncbi:hypothetical protein DL96DRAFT_1682899 [Flagelloscypha sp. PMI_526]|nr:hypothetical protein DL96DRAFT_1682899 [Flagelloscypha sp. PMI_526]